MDGNDRRNSRKERSLWTRHLVSSLQPVGQPPFSPTVLELARDRKSEALRSKKEVLEPRSSHVNCVSQNGQNGQGEGLEPRWLGSGRTDEPQSSPVTSSHSTFPEHLSSTYNVLGTSVSWGYGHEQNRQNLHLLGAHVLVGEQIIKSNHKK